MEIDGVKYDFGTQESRVEAVEAAEFAAALHEFMNRWRPERCYVLLVPSEGGTECVTNADDQTILVAFRRTVASLEKKISRKEDQ